MYSNIHSLDGGDFSRVAAGIGDPCLVLTTDPKPRLRWTAELHDRFVDAVTQLGGPDSKLVVGIFTFAGGVYGSSLFTLG
ncbi:PHR1-LIKE 2-like protein [Tanacetum coccineum]